MSKIKWRSELISVKKLPDELWIAEKFQSNSEIAGSPRNSFRASLDVKICGGRALKVLGASTRLLNTIKLRIPYRNLRSQTTGAKFRGQKGKSPDRQLRSQRYS